MYIFEILYESKSDEGKAAVQGTGLQVPCTMHQNSCQYPLINCLAETNTETELGSELESQLPDLETDSEYEVELKPDSESDYSEQEAIYWPDGQKKTTICDQSEPWSELEFETESDAELNGMFS